MSSNSYFQFKKFIIQMSDCAMKVGTDGVLLGAWFSTQDVKNLLDIGTGTGLLSLMAAQRGVPEITAVEIDPSAASQASGNIQNSVWSSSVKVINSDISDFQTDVKFDAIISNPPYFRDSLRSPDSKRTIAKHNDTLSFEQLIFNVCRFLAEDGEFSVIIPFDSLTTMEKICNINNLFLNRQTSVVTREGQNPKRVMLSFVKQQTREKRDVLNMTDLNGNDTEDYISLVKDFYLKY